MWLTVMLAFMVSASLAIAIYALALFNARLDRLEQINCHLLIETRRDHVAFAEHLHFTLPSPPEHESCDGLPLGGD